MENLPTQGSTDSTVSDEFKPLVIGSTPVDEILAKHRVPKGSLLHFDFIGAPDMHLLALLRAAIERGESVALVYVPTKGHLSGRRSCKDVRTPNPAACPLREQMGYYDLQGVLNEANPTDPAARLRYFVALTPDELEEDLDTLLGVSREGEPTSADTIVPGLVVVYGVDQLFTVKGLSKKGVSSRLKRLGRLVDTYSAHCARTGTTLWLGRSVNFHKKNASPILRGIGDLLYERCRFGLSVDSRIAGRETRTCADYRQGVSASLPATSGDADTLWHVRLYGSNTLLDTIEWDYESGYEVGDHILDGGPDAEGMTAFYDEQSLQEQSCQEQSSQE